MTPDALSAAVADELEAVLEELEAALADDIRIALTGVAGDFADAVEGATELVAARFSVGRIGEMWRGHIGTIVGRLRGIFRTGAETTAEGVGEGLPDGWEAPRAAYLEATEALLGAVGDRLAADATQVLADGLNAGESIDELKTRMLAVFDADGTKLGVSRSERIAMTEATRAWNAGTLAAAQALTGPDRPLVKQWLTRNDARVRVQHADVNGQIQFLDDPFDVAGTPMQYPGDPAAPADLTVNCRCVLVATAARTEGNDVSADGTGEVTAAADRSETLTAGSDGSHTSGAMIALIPTEADTQRLAIDGGEPAEQLHLTLFFLGEGAAWGGEARADLVERVAAMSRWLLPVQARAFGAAQWNPQADEPCWVWNVGDDRDSDGSRLADAHSEARWVLEDRISGPDIPPQYEPWSPHICAQYTADDRRSDLAARVGPVTFDRIRVVFAGDSHDFELTGQQYEEPDFEPVPEDVQVAESAPLFAMWHTPEGAGLAFENQQTGDGRLFEPGALYWTNGPWPLQYADEMNGGHEGARLAGAIWGMRRDGDRLDADGPLYLTQEAGAEAAMLLAQGAPLGVSVDLDDVDLELLEADGNGSSDPYRARLITASVMATAEGGWTLTGETEAEWTAAGTSLVGESTKVVMHIAADGTVPAGAFEVTAAAGDSDPGGVVVEQQRSGQYLARITRARVRGATLVSVPAFADARIVLDEPGLYASAGLTAAKSKGYAGSKAHDYDRVLRHVRRSLVPVSASDVAKSLSLPVADVRRYLQRATKNGKLMRLTRGTYVKPNEEDATASVAPVAVADDGPDHVFGDELSASSFDAFKDNPAELEGLEENMEASAWSAMASLPAMPSAWFKEPTDAELPPGGAGVNYSNGRIFGWVAQAGEPHAGFAKKITIDGLGRIDTSHFLRQRFTLDDGSSVKAGAFTMNVGHHRDGAECETAACQFDDTRTVAGIVTVGMNARGMWFSGAAAPWMSEWDRQVFAATQPSYHMKKGSNGQWQLRAVLSVPVPGHSSPLLASAVMERSQLALTAAATMVEVEEAVTAAEKTLSVADVAPEAEGIDYDRLAAAIVTAQEAAEQRRQREAAELAALIAEAGTLGTSANGTEGA